KSSSTNAVNSSPDTRSGHWNADIRLSVFIEVVINELSAHQALVAMGCESSSSSDWRQSRTRRGSAHRLTRRQPRRQAKSRLELRWRQSGPGPGSGMDSRLARWPGETSQTSSSVGLAACGSVDHSPEVLKPASGELKVCDDGSERSLASSSGMSTSERMREVLAAVAGNDPVFVEHRFVDGISRAGAVRRHLRVCRWPPRLLLASSSACARPTPVASSNLPQPGRSNSAFRRPQLTRPFMRKRHRCACWSRCRSRRLRTTIARMNMKQSTTCPCPASFYNLHQWQKECGFALPTTSEATSKAYHATLHQFASLTDDHLWAAWRPASLACSNLSPSFCLAVCSTPLWFWPSLEPGSPEFADENGPRHRPGGQQEKQSWLLTDWEDSTWLNLQTSLDGDWLALESLLDRHLLKCQADYVAFQKAFIVALMSRQHRCGCDPARLSQPPTCAGQRAAAQPADPWAHHSMAHVFHSTGATLRVSAYMLAPGRPAAGPGNHLKLSQHLAHCAVLYEHGPDRPGSRVDCVSLLFQVAGAGVDVGKRWQELCDSALTEMTAATAARLPKAGRHA
uniref:ANK_REP_REGION domain-containing protein n=1 Tax=Macrostomum lignano TaxID=282301 RepID=A0A1I8FR79_9PLAT